MADRFVNAGTETIVFRDDSGKRWVQPGEPFDVVGAQHVAHVAGIEGAEALPPQPPQAADVGTFRAETPDATPPRERSRARAAMAADDEGGA